MSRSPNGGRTARPGGRIGGLLVYVPVIGFVIYLAVVLIGGSDDWKATTLEVALLWLVGVNGIIVATGHLFMPASSAATIGWAQSPFQWEVGLADLSYGVLGIMTQWFTSRAFWLATIVAFSVFMLGAAVGHVRSMVRDHDFAPGNAGYFFWYDIVVPLGLIVLFLLTRP